MTSVKARLIDKQISLFDLPVMEKSIPTESLPVVIPHVVTPTDVVSPMSTEVSTVLPTIENLLDDYKEFLTGPCRSVHTIESFSEDIKRLGAFFDRDRLVSLIGHQDLLAFLSSERSRVTKSGKPLAKTTIFRRYTAIKNFFRWLYDTKRIKNNPAETIPFARVESPIPDVLSSAEVDLFLTAASATPMEYVIAMLLVGAGLKRCEVIALDLKDVNISDPLKPMVQIRAKHIFKTRIVTPPIEFARAYRQYIEGAWTRLIDHIPGQWSGSPKEFNFGGLGEGEPTVFSLTPRTLSYLVEDVATRAKIHTKVTCQILRDTFAVFQLLSGSKMDDVMKMLGLALSECNAEIRLKYNKIAEIERKKGTRKKCA